MEKLVTLEDALKRIEELEKENAALREELEYYRNRKLSGRQKHNAKWMAIYNDFVVGYGIDFAQKHRTLPYVGIVVREEE